VKHLINLLIAISLLLGSAAPGLAFGGEGQSRAASRRAQEGGAGSQTPAANSNEGSPTQPADEPAPAWLRLMATAWPEAAAPGEMVMLAWQVENLGGQTAEAGAALTAEMPAGVVVQPNQVEPPLTTESIKA
jgi:hypothetical protein